MGIIDGGVSVMSTQTQGGGERDGQYSKIVQLLAKLLELAEDTGKKVDKLHAVEVKMEAAVRRQAEQMEAERLERMEELRKEQREADVARREEDELAAAEAAIKQARADDAAVMRAMGL
jgi:hypothetical protein